MLACFEHSRGKGYVREEFPYIRKPRKDYRLEAKWEENDVKCFRTSCSPVRAAFWLESGEAKGSVPF